MKKINTKSFLKKFLETPLALILTIGVLGVFVYSIVSMISKQRIAQEAKEEAQTELSDLYKQKESLEAEIGLLTSDFGREKALREKFGVVQEGENVIVLVEDGEDVYAGDDGTFFQKIFGALGKLFGIK